MKLTELFNRSGQVTFSTAITLLQPVYLYAHSWNKTDKVAEVVRKNEIYICNKILIKGIDQGNIKGTYNYKAEVDGFDQPIYDQETNDKIYILDLLSSWVDISSLIKYVYADIDDINCIPVELQQYVDDVMEEAGNESIKLETMPNNCIDNDKYLDNSLIDNEPLKYLNIKNLKLENVTKEKFDEIKKYYGMLQREEAKSRKAIPIATNIGILFFEKGLSKPATKPEFMNAYKKEFSGIPLWAVDSIYEGLPDSYKSLAKCDNKQDACIDDDAVDAIISAAALAGFIARSEGVEALQDIKVRLAESGFEVPPDTYLKAITAVSKKLIKKNT